MDSQQNGAMGLQEGGSSGGGCTAQQPGMWGEGGRQGVWGGEGSQNCKLAREQLTAEGPRAATAE